VIGTESAVLCCQAFGAQMLKRLGNFATMSQMKRMAMLLLARTFTDKDVKRLKVGVLSLCHLSY
jgi:hypothetical protein